VSDHRTRLATVRELVRRGGARDGAGAIVGWLASMCEAAAAALPASGVAVSLMTDGGALAVAAASDGVAASLATLQFTLGEGPCVDAFGALHPILVPELAAVPSARWPGYTPAATALGVGAVFSFPLRIGAARLGALDAYRQQAGALTGPSVELALAFADVTVEVLLGARDLTAADDLGGLDDVLDSHFVVYQAQGMTMVDLGVSLADALARLRAHAFTEGRSLHDVARDVVDGRLRLEPDTL
jgi:ANTAR domain